jgi:uncharacterized protein (TIGR02145 family)/prepilin-type N-terminal cleavage/methylation domain-containing protein
MKKQKSAFTLIELLVVIAIIGILATIAVVALQNARAKARDARRVADVKQVQTALELFFNDMNRYPTAAEFAAGSIFSTSTQGTTTYMAIIPTPPSPADGVCKSSNNGSYSYLAMSSGGAYSIYYCLGGQVGSIAAGQHCATPVGIDDGNDCFPVDYSAASGNFTDQRDGQIYPWVKIDTQIWMSKNLNYNNGCASIAWVNYTDVGWCGCYDDNLSNCSSYGKLYQWSVTQNNLCPSGWHVATVSDFLTLSNYIYNHNGYNSSVTGNALKSTSAWSGGTDNYGFNALPAGFRQENNGVFRDTNNSTYFWSSNFQTPTDAYMTGLYSYSGVMDNITDLKTNAFSVRCVHD